MKSATGNIPRRVLSALGSAGLNRETRTILAAEARLERVRRSGTARGVRRDQTRSLQTAVRRGAFYTGSEAQVAPGLLKLAYQSIPLHSVLSLSK